MRLMPHAGIPELAYQMTSCNPDTVHVYWYENMGGPYP